MLCFPLFGVRVVIAPSFWLLPVLLGLLLMPESAAHPSVLAVEAVAAFLCLLTHEMGHALASKRLGGGAPEVNLMWLGGDCCNPSAELTRGQGVLMTAAGPAASLLLGLFGVALLIGCADGDAAAALQWCRGALFGALPESFPEGVPALPVIFCLGLVNICVWWSAFNLMPVFPLDGGQLLHGLFSASRVVHSVSIWFATFFCAIFIILGFWFLAVLMLLLCMLNYGCIDNEKH